MSGNQCGDSFFSANHQIKAVFEENSSIIRISRLGKPLYIVHTDFPFLDAPKEVVGSNVRSAENRDS